MGSRFLRDALHTAWVSLRLHPLRSVLSIVGIVCGVSTVLAIFAIGAGAEAEAMRRIGQLGVNNVFIRADNLSEQQLADARSRRSPGLQRADLDRLATTGVVIRRTAAVREHRVDPVGFPENLHPYMIEATRGYQAIVGLQMSAGRFLADRDIIDGHRVCVLGWSVSTALGPAGKPGATVRIGTDLWKVIGVIERRDVERAESGRISLQDINSMIIVPLGTIGAIDGGEPVSELLVELADTTAMQESLAVIGSTIKAAHNGVQDFSVIAPFELLAQAKSMQRLFAVVFGAIGTLSLIVGGIGIMNIMLAGVSERVREIGVRRAVGARPGHIVLQFLAEAVLLTVLGGLLGLGGGWLLASGVAVYAGWPVRFTSLTIAVPLVMAVVVGCLFGLYPAIRAGRLDPLEALGYRG